MSPREVVRVKGEGICGIVESKPSSIQYDALEKATHDYMMFVKTKQ